ncbi:puratrophin-1 [Polymixia lowei]
MPGCIHTVLLLADRDLSLPLDRPLAAQIEVLTSLKSLQKHVEESQLPTEFDGSFSFSHTSWLSFRSRVDKLTNQCEDVISLLQSNINIMESKPLPPTAEEAQVLSSRFRDMMRSILEDSRLVQLQWEGGASLSCLRKEESSFSLTEDYREAVQSVSGLYQQVDDLLHRMVQLSNSRAEELQVIMEFRSLEQRFNQVSSWIQQAGQGGPSLSLEQLYKKQQDFKHFYSTACEYCKVGGTLLKRLERWEEVTSSELQAYQVKVRSFRVQLQDFCQRVNATRERIDQTVHLYQFYDKAYGWALEGMRHLASVSMQDCTRPDKCQAVIDSLESYHRQHPPIPDEEFQEMKELAEELRSDQDLLQWRFAWSKCDQTRQTFDKKLKAALMTRRNRLSDPAHPQYSDHAHPQHTDPAHQQLTDPAHPQYSDHTHPQHTDPAHQQLTDPAHPQYSDHTHPQYSDHAHPQNSDPAHPQNSDHAHPQHTDQANPQCNDHTYRRHSESADSQHSDLAFFGRTRRRHSDSAHGQERILRASFSGWRAFLGMWGSSPKEEEGSSTSSSSSSSPRTPRTPQPSPLTHRLSRSTSEEEASSPCSSSGRQKLLRKSQSLDYPPTPEGPRYGPRAFNEPGRRGNTGVFIKGLEVNSTEVAERPFNPRTTAPHWARDRLAPPGTTRTTRPSSAAQPHTKASKLQHIVEELLLTERDYVRSLEYILQHYVPEMERRHLPHDLRGKRAVIFGNLERILEFHRQFFLKELEACWKHPLRVSYSFLRHKDQFGLYALYSKNKPRSDALLASHGNTFFKEKQEELGDRLDLASYLLKPIQRMSKYALLLADLIKEASHAQEAELASLRAATQMVKFQLRHGNDLLAMDAIRGCDVSLEEQGQLLRQDVFTVSSGRRSCQRRLFLFEEMLLFSKAKRMEGGLDVYIYKHSIKTADLGLTESSGDSGLRFEVWFRRRTSRNQTYVLQATTPDIKQTWTSDITRILWTQATRNKEVRLKDMLCMGLGNKPFMDIQPSEAAISDRAVDYIMKGRGARTRASIAVSAFDHSAPSKRPPVRSDPSVTSDPGVSGPSSSSLLGPLNLHLYSSQSSSISSCLEENEQETSSQPSISTESSCSSSRCLSGSGSGSTGSDSGCVSSPLQEVHSSSPPPSTSSTSTTSSPQPSEALPLHS